MRRFNYTGRRKLAQSQVDITLHDNNGTVEFDIDLDLADVRKDKSIPGDSAIFVEASTRSKFERIRLGTIAHPLTGTRHGLDAFNTNDDIKFRIKVVDAAEPGRLAMLQPSIRPASQADGRTRSLLPIASRPLNDIVFCVDFEEDEAPVLVLNEALENILEEGGFAFVGRPIFRSLVLPEVVRQILTKLLVIDAVDGDFDADEEHAKWQTGWVMLARHWNGNEMPMLEENDPKPRLQWIDEAVEGMARETHVMKQFEQGAK